MIQRDPAAHADMSDLVGVSRLIDSLRQVGADEQVAALLAQDPVSCADTADSWIFLLFSSLRAVGATEQLMTLAERALVSDHMIYPAYTAWLLDALHDVGARAQIDALVARGPAAHVDISEPLCVVLDLITALHKVGADEQAAAVAERAAAAADPDDLVFVSELLTTLREVGFGQLAPDRLINGLAARADITDVHEVAMVPESLAAVGADGEVSILLVRDSAADTGLSSPSDVAHLLTVLKEIGAEGQVAAFLARDPLAHVGQSKAGIALLDLLPLLQGPAVDTTVSALIERLPGEGSFTSFLRHSKRAEDYRFGRLHNGRPAASWGWDDLE